MKSQRRHGVVATRAATLVLVSLIAACGGGGGSPTAPGGITNTLAVIVDMRSSEATKPHFEIRIDGTLVGEQDYTQSSVHCQPPFGTRIFGKCAVGGSIQNVASGQHSVRVTLVNQVGPNWTWVFVGGAKLTKTTPVLSETPIDLSKQTRDLRVGDSVSWSLQISL